MDALKTLVFSQFLLLIAGTGALAQDAIPWVGDLNQAKEIAARENKLVLVHFWSHSCAPCLELDRYVFRNTEVGNAVGKDFVPVKINVAEHPDLARQFDIREIPKDIVLTPSGRELERGTSPNSANGYIQLVSGAAKRAANGGQRGAQDLAQAAREAQHSFDGGQFDARQSGYDGQSPTGYDPRTGKALPRSDSNRQVNRQPSQNVPPNPWDNYSLDGNQNPKTNSSTSQQRDPSADAPVNRSQVIYNQYGESRDRDTSVAQNPRNEYGSRNEFGPRQDYDSNLRGGFDQAQRPLEDFSEGNRFQNDSSIRTAHSPDPVGPRVTESRETYGDNVRTDVASPTTTRGASTPSRPPIGLDGYCPVSLVEAQDLRQAWRKGDPTWGAVHRGRLYFFVSRESQQKFLSSPDKYAPGLSCYDPVLFVDNNKLVDGARSHGVSFRGQVFLFSDEASLKAFWQNPSRYTTVVQQAMQQNRSNGTMQR